MSRRLYQRVYSFILPAPKPPKNLDLEKQATDLLTVPAFHLAVDLFRTFAVIDRAAHGLTVCSVDHETLALLLEIQPV